MNSRFPAARIFHPVKGLMLPVLGAFLCSWVSAPAAIVLSGNFQTGVPTPTLTITQDFDLLVTVSGSSAALVFQEWKASNGSSNLVASAPLPQPLSYQINSGPIATMELNGLRDNLSGPFGALSPNDGLLLLENINLTAGQIFTVKAQTLTFASDPTYNQNVSLTFTGSVFGMSVTGGRITASTVVPELTTWSLAVAAGLLGLRRRRMDCAA